LFKPDMPGEDNLVYDGNSQGGIMGGALCALSVDLRRCVLGVTGMNYSTLLNRSVDWEGGLVSYSTTMYSTFPDKPTQQLVEELVQMLWDRAEADGYAEHMTTDPYPDTPPHQVLMDVAVGDFQVTNWSAEVEARTIGARLLSTSIPVRFWERNFAWGNGLAPYSGNTGGSAFVWWDSGNLPPPDANAPPNPSGQTDDPHEDPRRDPRAADQKAEFWTTGVIKDVMASSAHPYGTCRPGEAGNIPRAPQQNFEDDWCTPTTLASYGF
jgi:hypothetical protein